MVSPKQLARTKHLMRSLRGRFAMFFLSPHACLAACMLSCSCTPIPMTKGLSGPAGVTKAGKVDLSFIEVGRTSGDELVQEFSWVDTGIKSDHLFWARWAFSDSGWVWSGPDDCAVLCRDAGPYRDWRGHNLIVDFDDAGLVRSCRDLATLELIANPNAWMAQLPPPVAGSPSPIELRVFELHPQSPIATAKLVLAADSFRFQDLRKPRNDFQIRPATVMGISSESDAKEGRVPDLALIEVTMVLKEATSASQPISFNISAADLLVLIKHLHFAYGSPHVP
jgi:hypothetical protein